MCQDGPATSTPRAAPVAPGWLCLAVLVAALTVALALANFRLVAQPALGEYQAMQERVLRNHARNYYQYDMYFLCVVDRALQTRLHVPPLTALTGLFTVSYLAALLASWYWLRQLYRQDGPVVIGLLATAVYALAMLPFSYHHPSDMAALACFALSLGLIVRRRWGWLLVVCVVAGLFSSKQVLIAVPLFLEQFSYRPWRQAAPWAVGGALAALAVPLLYRFWLLGYHGLSADGTLGATEWLRMLPYAGLVHFMLAAAPLVALARHHQRLVPAVAGGLAAYLALVMICVVQLNIIHEARTFWVGVPAFAAALALWSAPDSEAT